MEIFLYVLGLFGSIGSLPLCLCSSSPSQQLRKCVCVYSIFYICVCSLSHTCVFSYVSDKCFRANSINHPAAAKESKAEKQEIKKERVIERRDHLYDLSS